MGVEDQGGAAFGVKPLNWLDRDRLPQEVASTVSQWQTLAAFLATADREEIEDFQPSIGLLSPGVRRGFSHHAFSALLTLALNDASALVRHVMDGDGRSAAQVARTLFEHLVNLADMRTSPVNSPDRYLDHQWVMRAQIAKSREHLALLEGSERTKEERRLEKMARTSDRHLAAALQKYGKGFIRGWAEGSLRTRAEAHDLEQGYERYRILSSVIHGSTGGLAGITRAGPHGIVHRYGQDLDLAAIAWLDGLTFFAHVSTHLVEMTGSWEAEEIMSRTQSLVAMWSRVRRALRKRDRLLWPDNAPPGPIAVAAIYPGPTVRWYYHDLHLGVMMLAEPPNETPPGLGAVLEDYTHYDPAAYNGRPLTAAFGGVTVRPIEGAKLVRDTAVIVPGYHPAIERPASGGHRGR